MRTILLTFSPNMTLINEAVRFHHTFSNLGWAPTTWFLYQQFSPFIFIRQSLDLPPNIPVRSEPLGGHLEFVTTHSKSFTPFWKKKKPQMNIPEYMSHWFWRENRELLVTSQAGGHSTECVMAGTLCVSCPYSPEPNHSQAGSTGGQTITLSAIRTQLHVEINVCKLV